MTIPETLGRLAATTPDARAYVALDDRGVERAELTWDGLHRRALAVADRLRERCRPGDRALLAFASGCEFPVAFLGCLYAGVVAVPVGPPRRRGGAAALTAVVADCTPAAVLADAATVPALREVPACAALPLVEIGLDRPAGAAAGPPRPCTPDTPALLQYTSGSTSAPKGVLVSHGNLTANEEMQRRTFGHDATTTVVGWAPLHHDQGLIGNLLQPLHVGATCVLLSPTAFLRRPLLWPETVSRYRAHTSGGPDFAFEACVAAAARRGLPADLDLSCWKAAFDGAEPVRPATLRAFAATFGPAGFAPEALFPCYGLAEATLIVTGPGTGRGPRFLDVDAAALGRGEHRPARPGEPARVLAGSGSPLPGGDVRIVDPDTLVECPADRVGEIWVAGPHVTGGYWRRPDATAVTFGGRLAGREERYLRTGDLGFLQDGELYVVGRRSDVVVVRGRNHHPHDVERTARAAHPALRDGVGAAFGVPGEDGAEQLVVVQEIGRGPDGIGRLADGDPLPAITAAVRAAVTREHGIAPREVVLTRPGTLARTTSGKIMRRAARERYLGAGFDTPRETRQEATAR